jgi:hypothetical protein
MFSRNSVLGTKSCQIIHCEESFHPLMGTLGAPGGKKILLFTAPLHSLDFVKCLWRHTLPPSFRD